MTECSCCATGGSCIDDNCITCCECKRVLYEEQTGYLVIKVKFVARDVDDVTQLSTDCVYTIKHPDILETEMVGATEERPL